MKTCLIGYPIRTFQSLLWRICHFDLKNRTYISIYSICFNPCYDGFVILTFFRCYTILIYCLCVSILVMTDLSFWLKPLCSFLVVFFGFNPCYDGFVILTPVINILTPAAGVFQSLLWRICHFDVKYGTHFRIDC